MTKRRSLFSTTLAICLIACLPGFAGSAAVERYEMRLELTEAGSGRATLVASVVPSGATELILPFPFPKATSLRLIEAPAGASMSIEVGAAQSNLRIHWPTEISAPFSLKLAGDVSDALPPRTAARTVRVAVMNSQPEVLRGLRLDVVFPEGLRGHAIREALPKAASSDGAPRAALEDIDGRPGARLQVDELSQGETAALRVELSPATRSPGWLLAGLLLSVLYLVSFRDLVARQKN